VPTGGISCESIDPVYPLRAVKTMLVGRLHHPGVMPDWFRHPLARRCRSHDMRGAVAPGTSPG